MRGGSVMLEKLVSQDPRKHKSTTMQITTCSETQLALSSTAPQETETFARYSAVIIVSCAGLYGFFRLVGIHSLLGVPRGFFAFAFVVLSILLVVATVVLSSQSSVESCVLDKETGTVTIVKKVVWRLFRPTIEVYRLMDIVSVILSRTEYNLRLHFELKSGAKVKLVDESALSTSATEIGQQISDFLSVPLSIDLGGRTPIETYPAEDDDSRVNISHK
jgi:hypothetical protein